MAQPACQGGKDSRSDPPPHESLSRMLCDDDYFHMHVFVTFTADHGRNNLIFARLVRHFQDKFLDAGFEFKVPVGKFRAIFLADQRKPVNGSISVEGLGLLGRYSEY